MFLILRPFHGYSTPLNRCVDVDISVNKCTNVGVEKLLVASLALLELQLHLDVVPTGLQNRILVVGQLQPVQRLHHGCDLRGNTWFACGSALSI